MREYFGLSHASVASSHRAIIRTTMRACWEVLACSTVECGSVIDLQRVSQGGAAARYVRSSLGNEEDQASRNSRHSTNSNALLNADESSIDERVRSGRFAGDRGTPRRRRRRPNCRTPQSAPG